VHVGTWHGMLAAVQVGVHVPALPAVSGTQVCLLQAWLQCVSLFASKHSLRSSGQDMRCVQIADTIVAPTLLLGQLGLQQCQAQHALLVAEAEVGLLAALLA
jgi:hypothetical protein